VANSDISRNKAFQSVGMSRTEHIFELVPPDIDILMTHGPLDTLPPAQAFLKKNRTPYFCCGHVHEDYGTHRFGSTICCNASTMANKNNRFQPSNSPIVMDIPPTLLNPVPSL
jgi:hypothetical protein